jgi:hypothetical protein
LAVGPVIFAGLLFSSFVAGVDRQPPHAENAEFMRSSRGILTHYSLLLLTNHYFQPTAYNSLLITVLGAVLAFLRENFAVSA